MHTDQLGDITALGYRVIWAPSIAAGVLLLEQEGIILADAELDRGQVVKIVAGLLAS